jgi:hypothetical protein
LQDKDKSVCVSSKKEVARFVGVDSWRADPVIHNDLSKKSLELVEFKELKEFINKIIGCG